MDNDTPIHLGNYPFCKKQQMTEDSVTVPVWLTQSSLDAICGLIKFFEGVESGGKGRVSGAFELTMFYRIIKNCLNNAKKNWDDTQKSKNEENIYSVAEVRKLCGGSFPIPPRGGSYENAGEFHLVDNRFVPCDNTGEMIPYPDLKMMIVAEPEDES